MSRMADLHIEIQEALQARIHDDMPKSGQVEALMLVAIDFNMPAEQVLSVYADMKHESDDNLCSMCGGLGLDRPFWIQGSGSAWKPCQMCTKQTDLGGQQ